MTYINVYNFGDSAVDNIQKLEQLIYHSNLSTFGIESVKGSTEHHAHETGCAKILLILWHIVLDSIFFYIRTLMAGLCFVHWQGGSERNSNLTNIFRIVSYVYVFNLKIEKTINAF